MAVLLIASYEMGRQPFGLASPAAWLRRAGCEVHCADVSRTPLELATLARFEAIAFYLPMHTATRLALQLLPGVRAAAPAARLCAFGLYAAINETALRAAGFSTVLGPEFEAALVAWATSAPAVPVAELPRLHFCTPDRTGLAPLSEYAGLQMPDGTLRVTGYTEASRGCKHHCRHCPIVPVYQGQFRIVERETVLSDIRQQVASGAAHITFGDPDFFNGPTHALRLAQALHAEFPQLSFDVTIKVEHLLRHRALLPQLRQAGCVLITTAVESFDDDMLLRFDKGHTVADFHAALALTRSLDLALNPTFVAFTPWTTPASFARLCATIAGLDLIGAVAPVQYGIELLVPSGSRLLQLLDTAAWLGEFDPAALGYRWRYLDPATPDLCAAVQAEVATRTRNRESRAAIFQAIADLALPHSAHHLDSPAPDRATVPYLNEPWFC